MNVWLTGKRNVWWIAIVGLILSAFCRYFDGTDFAQDDFVWLCFSKFHPFPLEVFWTDSLCGQFYRPIGQMWWVVIHSLAGDRVLAYQIAFLAVHLINSILVAKLTSRIVSPEAGIAAFPLFLTSPIFIARISPFFLFIFDTFGFFFCLCAILLELSREPKRRVWMSVAALLCALAAYFTKEAYFTLPAVLVLVLGTSAEQGWSWFRAWQFRGRLLSHWVALIVALVWRREIIGGLGGYGLAHPRSFGEFVAHISERVMTLAGFAGWSLSPFLSRWDRSMFVPLILSLVTFLVLFVLAWRIKFRPGVWWVLVWLVVTWSPSSVMTTYAPVSFYAPLVAPVILVAGISTHFRRWRWFIMLIVAFNAGFSVLFFDERSVAMSELHQQKQKLIKMFDDGSIGARPGDRIILLRANMNLFPDPIIKYRSPPHQPLADVLFVNTRFPVAWVICNESGPGRISPMTVSSDYQSGEMPMGSLKAIPLSYQKQMREIVMTGAPFRFFVWQNGTWDEIDPKELMNR